MDFIFLNLRGGESLFRILNVLLDWDEWFINYINEDFWCVCWCKCVESLDEFVSRSLMKGICFDDSGGLIVIVEDKFGLSSNSRLGIGREGFVSFFILFLWNLMICEMCLVIVVKFFC